MGRSSRVGFRSGRRLRMGTALWEGVERVHCLFCLAPELSVGM